MRRSFDLGACLLLLTLAACGSGESTAIAFSWQLADGRTCADSGAATVVVRVPSGKERAERCADGMAPASISLADLSLDGASLAAEARSLNDGVLYRGEAFFFPLPAHAILTLYPLVGP